MKQSSLDIKFAQLVFKYIYLMSRIQKVVTQIMALKSIKILNSTKDTDRIIISLHNPSTQLLDFDYRKIKD